MDLNHMIKECIVLNVDMAESTVSRQEIVMKKENINNKSYIISDADEELLILIQFTEITNLKNIVIHCLAQCEPIKTEISAPKQIDIFKLKHINLNFDDIRSMKPDKTTNCSIKKLVKGQNINLCKNSKTAIKFQKIQYLAIYIKSNQNDTEQTYLNGFTFYGPEIYKIDKNNKNDIRNIEKLNELITSFDKINGNMRRAACNKEIIIELVSSDYGTYNDCLLASALSLDFNDINKVRDKLDEITNKDNCMTNKIFDKKRKNILNKALMTIYGYIRENYMDSTNIPNDIIQIFYAFYTMPIRKFISFKKNSNMMIKSLNLLNGNILRDNIKSILIEHEENERSIKYPICYIPDISLLINLNNNTSKDVIYIENVKLSDYEYGFLSTTYKTGSMPGDSPSIILINRDNINIKPYYHRLPTQFPDYGGTNIPSHFQRKPIKYVFCGKEVGILILMKSIGPSNYGGVIAKRYYKNSFFQIKLDDLYRDEYIMNKLDGSMMPNSINDEQTPDLVSLWYGFWGKQKEDNFLEIEYLPSYNTIFGIDCFWNLIGLHGNTDTRYNTTYDPLKYEKPQQRKCGLFNLKTNEWTNIKPFEYELGDRYCINSTNDIYFRCGITRDYDENNLYMLCHLGITAVYNFKKNIWIKICKDTRDSINPYNNISMWFDNYNHNILYGLFYSKLGFHSNSKHRTFQYFDIRDNKRKWNKIEPNQYQQYNDTYIQSLI